MKSHVIGIISVLFCLVPLPSPVLSQAPPSDSAGDPVAAERLRSQVETIFDDHLANETGRERQLELFVRAARHLASLGPDAVPYLEGELGADRPDTFYLTAYALGHIPSAGSEEVLRRYLKRTDEERSPYASAKKMWLCYGLALLGHADVVGILNSEPNFISQKELMRGARILSVTTVLTAPESVDLLFELLKTYDPATESGLVQTTWGLYALRQVVEPGMIPRVLPYLESEHGRVRKEAAAILAGSYDRRAVNALLGILGTEPLVSVRQAAARGIEKTLPPDRIERVIALLEREQDPYTRGCYYRALVRLRGPDALEVLRKHWGRKDAMDRVALVRAVGQTESASGLNLVRRATADTDTNVAIHAIGALEQIGTAGARETLLVSLRDPRWPVARTALEALVHLEDERAAPRIVTLLEETSLEAHGFVSARSRSRILSRALVDFRYTEAIEMIRGKVEGETDGEIRADLQDAANLLRLVQTNGDDVEAWVRALGSSSESIQGLAYSNLARIGGSKAADALLARFEAADRSEREEILHVLGEMAAPEAAPLLEKVLLGEDFDYLEERTQRAFAAWAAYRIGGGKMATLLGKAAERREYHDFFVVLYWAGLRGTDALPALLATPEIRFRRPGRSFGLEQTALNKVARELAAGREPELPGLDPEEVHIRENILLEH